MSQTRTETDSIGPIEVPGTAYWGAQTQRSLQNFPFPANQQMPLGIVYGQAAVKQAAARTNGKHGLDATIVAAIEDAATAIRAGEFDQEFPLTIFQTGSGTQTNMNVNEVIAGIANEKLAGTRGGKSPVHPNDHVNMSQSSNDSFPTALHIATALATRDALLPAIDTLIASLQAKCDEFADIVKIGRTHTQDATPLTLGQEFSGYVAQLVSCKARIEGALDGNIRKLAIGGTAVGTGLNAPDGWAQDMADAISDITGMRFESAPNKFEQLAAKDGLVFFSGALNTLAVALNKIANDIRFLGSGPRSGLGELALPENEPGSSIMPGKVNPTQCEALTQVCAHIHGNNAAIGFAGSQGHFELNVYNPMMAYNFLQSVRLLADAAVSFTENCVVGIEPRLDNIERGLKNSLMLVTPLKEKYGYDLAAKVAKTAHKNGTTLREEAIALGIPGEDFDAIVRPETMIAPG